MLLTYLLPRVIVSVATVSLIGRVSFRAVVEPSYSVPPEAVKPSNGVLEDLEAKIEEEPPFGPSLDEDDQENEEENGENGVVEEEESEEEEDVRTPLQSRSAYPQLVNRTSKSSWNPLRARLISGAHTPFFSRIRASC